MFAITTKSHYGVTALMDLAQHYELGLVQIKEIVQRRGIPKTYLEQIFNRMSKHGLVKSVRGNKGGYLLTRNPARISLLSVLEALEGGIVINKYQGIGAVDELYTALEKEIKRFLSISLAELVQRQESRKQEPMFYI